MAEARNNKLLDIATTANRLGVGERIVRRWVNEGYLGSHRIGRRHFVSEGQIRTFLEETQR